METKIISQTENPLFRRKEVLLEAMQKSSPSREQTLTVLSKQFSVPEEAIKIKKIDAGFGRNNFKISAHIYSSKEDKESVEIKKKKDEELVKKKAEAEKAAKETEQKVKEEVKSE